MRCECCRVLCCPLSLCSCCDALLKLSLRCCQHCPRLPSTPCASTSATACEVLCSLCWQYPARSSSLRCLFSTLPLCSSSAQSLISTPLSPQRVIAVK